MERLAALFEQVGLPEISRMLRRTVFAAIGVGIVGFIVLAIVGQPIVAVGGVIGLAVGVFNMRLIMRTASRLNTAGDSNVKRPLAMNTATRLGLLTVLILGLAFVSTPLAFGLLGGIAIFYFLFLASLARTLFHSGAVA